MIPDPVFYPEASNKDGQGQEVYVGQGLGLILLWKGSLANLKQTQSEERGEEPGEWGGLRLEKRPPALLFTQCLLREVGGLQRGYRVGLWPGQLWGSHCTSLSSTCPSRLPQSLKPFHVPEGHH